LQKTTKQGHLEIYQSIQSLILLQNCEYVFSFLGTEGTEGRFLGCYKITGHIPLKQAALPSDVILDNKDLDNCVYWQMDKASILEDLIDRLVIDWGKGAIQWWNNAKTEKEVLYILPRVSEFEFVSYDKVLLPFKTLEVIVTNSKEHKEWKNKLSAVAGIYLITDVSTGKHYVGSASGADGGIWARWSDYVKTKHGGNIKLMELINAIPDYYNNFQFSILDVFPIKRDLSDILKYEALYKKKLCSIQFGLNGN